MDRRIYNNYVVQIAEHGSLTKAAVALGITQPALSSGLTYLENEIGIKIFNRRTVPISFTPEGKIYFDYIEHIRLLDSDLKMRLDRLHNEANNKVVIGGPVVYTESIITDAIIKLRAECPEYRVEVKSASLPNLIDMANKGEINCFVSTSNALPDNYAVLPIKKETIYLCIPKDNPLNQELSEYRVTRESPGGQFDYSILDGERFIFLEANQPLQKQLNTFLSTYGIHPNNFVIVNQVSTAVSLSIKGEGICFASDASLSAVDEVQSVGIYPLPNDIAGRQLYVAYDKELSISTACKKIMVLLGANL